MDDQNQLLSIADLEAISGTVANPNMQSICKALDARGVAAGLGKPHRLAQFVAQIAHESGRFRFDREVWGPTPAQARYDTRTDLGNTAAKDGDGYKYRGRTGIQITGKANVTAFRDWARALFTIVPDFVEDPDRLNEDPWEGLGPIWYWETRDLNRFADEGNNEMITRRINGGLNGFDDRLELYDRAALVFLGYPVRAIRKFQEDAGITVDGESGPQTRRHMHQALQALPALASDALQATGSQGKAEGAGRPLSPVEVLSHIRDLIDATIQRTAA